MIYEMQDIKIDKNLDYISLRCPNCRQLGTFHPIMDYVITIYDLGPEVYLGQRCCPNKECKAHVFIVWDSNGKILESYPPERIDFDASSLPGPLLKSFEEAINCHSNNSYTAAAIMVRRTLEDLCADQKAEGKDLKTRITALSSKVILPPRLLDGLDNLRLLGNDSAHVEAQVYTQIGKEEVELAIDVTKEVLKSIYQLDDLIARLEGKKKPKT